MRLQTVEPDVVSYNSIIHCCAEASMRRSWHVHKYIKLLYLYILRGCAHGRAAHAEARGEQFLSMLRPLNSLKISKR